MKDSKEEVFQIKRLGREDLQLARQLSRVLQEVFEMENPGAVPAPYLEKLLARPDFIAYVITCGDEVAGGLTAYELPMFHSAYSEIFIYDIAVKPEFQRKGLGRRLLLAIQEYAGQQGIEELFVPASEDDQHALDFYQATGGSPEKVVHFSYQSLGSSHLFLGE